MYWLEARYELTKLARLPGYAIPTLVFPLMFYLLFGIALNRSRMMGGQNVAPYLLASYGAFGVIGAALFGFGVGIATERAQGWLLLKRATPMPALVYVFGKVGAAMAFGALIVLALGISAAVLGGVHLALGQWVLLAAVLVFGTVPFCALGLALGFAVGPNSAPAVVNLLHLPAALASGLWMPVEMLPTGLRVLAPWLPQYHLGQLALAAVGLARDPRPAWNLAMLTAWAVAGIAAAAYTWRRDEGALYG